VRASVIATLLLVCVVVLGGAASLIALHSGEAPPVATFLAASAATVLVLLPFVVATTTASLRHDTVTMRARRTASAVVVVLDVSAAIGVGVWSISVAAPWWVPAAIVACGAALLAGAPAVGRFLRERAPSRWADPDAWQPVTGVDVQRSVRRMAVTFVAVTAVSILLLILIGSLLRAGEEEIAEFLVFAVGFGFLAASIVGSVASFRLQSSLTQLAGGSAVTTRRLRDLILRREGSVPPEEEQRAARYAATLAHALTLQLLQQAALFAGLACTQIPLLGAGGAAAVLQAVFAAIVLVVFVVVFPLMGRQIARARRYARARGELLTAAPPRG
jgi:hypothetical protein